MPQASWSGGSSGSTIPAAPASPTVRCSAGSPEPTQEKPLLRRLNAVLADRDARRDELAVAFDARAAEDRFTGLEVGARAGHEGDDLGVLVDQDLLLAILVLEGELVAAARLSIGCDVGVGHEGVGRRIPGAMHLR